MIIINDKKYTEYDTKISYGTYEAKIDEKLHKGTAPFICFKNEDFILCIECVYDINWINDLKIGSNTDITKYISDITYEIKKDGWDSLITGKHTCFFKKLDKNNYEINLECIYDDFDYIVKIKIQTTINI